MWRVMIIFKLWHLTKSNHNETKRDRVCCSKREIKRHRELVLTIISSLSVEFRLALLLLFDDLAFLPFLLERLEPRRGLALFDDDTMISTL